MLHLHHFETVSIMCRLSVAAAHKLCMNGIISTTQYWKIKNARKKKNYSPTYFKKPFKFDSFSPSDCILLFRFTPNEIHHLLSSLKIPAVCHLANKGKFTGLEGICILLRRLSYPNRLTDLVPIFNRSAGTLSKIFKFMINYIYSTHSHALKTLNQPYITREKWQEFAEASVLSGCPYPNIVGYIDGTSRPICRPKYIQRNYWSGYKKKHVLKYQSIVLPNGLIGRLDGPFIGRRHDAAILNLSKVLEEMGNLFMKTNGTWYAVYGDPGYSNQKYVKVGYKNHAKLNEHQKEFNAKMSSLRVSVEYGFGKIIQQFAYLDYFKNQKINLQPIKKMYYVAALLVNCQLCLRGKNQISDLFGCLPPTLSEYLSVQ